MDARVDDMQVLHVGHLVNVGLAHFPLGTGRDDLGHHVDLHNARQDGVARKMGGEERGVGIEDEAGAGLWAVGLQRR